MLTTSIDDHGRLVATQRDSSPTVYLDHWALRELSTTAMRDTGHGPACGGVLIVGGAGVSVQGAF